MSRKKIIRGIEKSAMTNIHKIISVWSGIFLLKELVKNQKPVIPNNENCVIMAKKRDMSTELTISCGEVPVGFRRTVLI
ncbi:hypothetical protein D3C72_1851520 [compost metagenome]